MCVKLPAKNEETSTKAVCLGAVRVLLAEATGDIGNSPNLLLTGARGACRNTSKGPGLLGFLLPIFYYLSYFFVLFHSSFSNLLPSVSFRPCAPSHLRRMEMHRVAPSLHPA